jgi:hypothetical protein
MPTPPRTGGPPFSYVRNTSSPHWRGWLKPENRCLAPASSFANMRRSRTRIPNTAKKIDGRSTSDENVPETSPIFFGTRLENWEFIGMEDFAMLLFYLPFIIFEAMLEANLSKRKPDDPTVIE